MKSNPIRVVIAVGDLSLMHEMREVLGRNDDVKVVDVARDGQGVVNLCKLLKPDVVLIDLHLTGVDGINAIEQIIADREATNVLATSAVADDRYAVEAIKVGASGYLLLSQPLDEATIINSIRDVARGDAWLSPDLASSILAEFHRLDPVKRVD